MTISGEVPNENEVVNIVIEPNEARNPVEIKENIFAKSAKIEGAALPFLWENLRESRSISAGDFDTDRLVDHSTIAEAIREDMKPGRPIRAEISKFISSPQSRELSRKLGAEVDFNNLSSDQSIKAVTKLVSFLYYRQQIFNICNFPDIPQDASIRGDLSLSLSQEVWKLRDRLNYCIDNVESFTPNEKKALKGFAFAKIKLSATLSYMVNQVDGADYKYSKVWNDFFGRENSPGMPFYNDVLKYSKELHISFNNAVTDFFHGLGYDRDPSGKLTRRHITLVRKEKPYTREVDSRPDLLLNHVGVMPNNSQLERFVDNYIPDLKKLTINGVPLTLKQQLAHVTKILDTRKWVNSQCDPLMFRLYTADFDTGLLNQLAERNIGGPAGLISRAAESFYREQGNDKFKQYSITEVVNGVKVKKSELFWNETIQHKGSAANKNRIGSMWPAFAIWYARVDIFLKYGLFEKFFGVKFISVLNEQKRAQEMSTNNVMELSESPLYKDVGGELKEVMVRPIIAKAYNLLIRELDNLRILWIGKMPSGDISDYVIGKEPKTKNSTTREFVYASDDLFTVNGLTGGKDKKGVYNSLFPKFSKIYESLDKLSSPGTEDLSLLNPAKVFELMKKLLYGGENTSSQDMWDKFLPNKYKLPLITAALLNLSFAVWQKNVDYQFTILSKTKEVQLLSKITQLKNFIGSKFFSIRNPDRSLVALESFPYIRFLEEIYNKNLSPNEKRVMKAKASPRTSNPSDALYDNALLADYFQSPRAVLNSDEDEKVLDAIKIKSDLSAISNWLALDRINQKEPLDYLPILGAYWGDILHGIVEHSQHHPNEDLTVDPNVRSRQVAMIQAYLGMRQKLNEPLTYVDAGGRTINLGTKNALEYFEKNGFMNERGGQLAKMMATDYQKILGEVLSRDGTEVLEYLEQPQNEEIKGFLTLFHNFFVTINIEANGVPRLDRKLVEKKPDGFSGIGGAALAFKDFCAAIVGTYEVLDTNMGTSYSGEAAGKIARNIHNIRERMNKYWVGGEYEDFNISHFAENINPAGSYKAGKPKPNQDRITYYGDGYPLYLSKLPGTMTGVVAAYCMAAAPLCLGGEEFIKGTNDALDQRTTRELPFDEDENSLEKHFRHSVEQHGKVSFDHAEGVIRDIFGNVFLGHRPDSGRMITNKWKSAWLLNKTVGWWARSGEKDEKNIARQEEARGGKIDEGLQAAGAMQPLRAAGKQLGKRIWGIGFLLNKVGEGVEGVKNLPLLGMVAVAGITGGIFSAPFVTSVVASLVATFPVRFLDSWVESMNFKKFKKKSPLEQYYSFWSQKKIIEGARKIYYSNNQSPFLKGLAQAVLGNFPVNTSLEMRQIEPTLNIHVDYNLPLEPKKS